VWNRQTPPPAEASEPINRAITTSRYLLTLVEGTINTFLHKRTKASSPLNSRLLLGGAAAEAQSS
jgi:hypothetical protein